MKQLLRAFFVVVILSLAVVSCETDGVDESGMDTDSGGETTGGGDDTSDNDDESDWVDPDGVIEMIDETLCQIYLYNEEYAALENRDFSLAFDDFFYGNLMSLTTNVLDYKEYNGEMYLYSYIEATAPDGTTRSATRSSSGMSNDFGFVYMTPVYDGEGTLGFYVLACYNDSPVDKLGICRGMVIYEINGEALSVSNYSQYMYRLLYPSAGDSYSLKLFIKGENSQTLTVTTDSYATNPVLNCEIIDEQNSVGYLNYILFDSSYDNEMLSAFETLKSGGAETLILDLRYNLGGYISSASKMMSAITSTSSGSGQIFSYYRFNNDLTSAYESTSRWAGLNFDSSVNMFYETLSGVSDQYKLSLTESTIYVLVGNNTASASEMVINSLQGMGYNVVLIGQTTRGKNVGMFVFEESFDGYEYEIVPISFENFNSLCEGGYESGFTPDYPISEGEEMSGFNDFSKDEPLIAKALSLITDSPSESVNLSRSVESSSEVTPLGGVMMQTDRRHGALKRVEK